ncbi:MAG TPA: TM2 domain-containing protein [Allosphingosinicella sp.]|jgi:hypothetical protein
MAGQFGRKVVAAGVGPVSDIDAKRAAFVAAERARRQSESEKALGEGLAVAGAVPRTVYRTEKSLTAAYVLWFFLGGASAHRFYLGFPTSGFIQLFLRIGGFAMFLSAGSAKIGGANLLLATAMMAAGGLWLLLDAFLIPGLCANANLRARSFGSGYHAYA